MRKSLFSLLTFLVLVHLSISAFSQTGPKPGDIYKEYSLNLKTGNNWRVTDPTVTREDALPFLPNPVLSINIDDLSGAVRAEVLMDIWGGHVGTSNKRFRFNSNEWIRITELPTINLQPECYMSQYNVVMDMPLNYLVQGTNTFEGTSGGQICNSFNWGQWGWYVMTVRVYYGSDKPHTKGNISYPLSGSSIQDNPEIVVAVDNPANVQQVQILGKYFGYDENGDGNYHDWHHAYHGPNIESHIGTSTTSPFKSTWNTTWVPDQQQGGVSFMARIRGTNGVWYVTDIAENITLDRTSGPSVKMYTSIDIPLNFVVRQNNNGTPRTKGCKIPVTDLEEATEARLFHRTWNGADDDAARGTILLPMEVNGTGFKTFGINHNFALSSVVIPTGILKSGLNDVTYSSNTVHHGIEVLWPGPAIMVRYNKPQTDKPEKRLRMLGYWGFNEGTGTKALDGSVYKNDMNLSTGTVFGEGVYGTALSLNKENKDHASIESGPLSSTFISAALNMPAEVFTIAAWIKLNSIDDRSPIISKEELNKRGFEFAVRNGYLAAQIYKDGTNFTRVEGSGTLLETGRWYHVAMTYKFAGDGNSAVRFYVDGAEDRFFDSSVGPVITNNAPLRIGAYYSSSTFYRYFNGSIDEVYVFDRELSAQEINEIKNAETLALSDIPKPAGARHFSVYPNPFTNMTNFVFELDKPSEVNLVIYDAMGRSVMVLVNEKLGTGNHNREFIANGIAPGLYFGYLKTDSGVEVRRLVVN